MIGYMPHCKGPVWNSEAQEKGLVVCLSHFMESMEISRNYFLEIG